MYRLADNMKCLQVTDGDESVRNVGPITLKHEEVEVSDKNHKQPEVFNTNVQ